MSKLLSYVPGISLSVAVACTALVLNTHLGMAEPAIWAVTLGVLLSNSLRLPSYTGPGITLCAKQLLKLAVVALGMKMALGAVLGAAGTALSVIIASVLLGLAATYYVGQRMGMSKVLSLLIGTGTAICGVSAIVAAGPILEAEDEDLSMAIATIFVFNTFALFVYPLLGGLIGMSDTAFGTWVGCAVHDTSSVVATGFAYSESAGEVATIVKLTRTVMLVPLLVALSMLRKNVHSTRNEDYNQWAVISLPWFVVGFVLMALLNTLGFLPSDFVALADRINKYVILIVIAAIGLGIDLTRMRAVGFQFLYCGLIASLIVSAVSLGMITVLGIG